MSFADKIKEARLKRNLTQEQLAELIGIHPRTYRSYEAGKTVPRIAIIRKLCIALEASSDDLLEIYNKFIVYSVR